MAGTLASYQDANTHLDETKLSFVDEADAADEASEAFEVIAARIGGLWPEYIETWDHNPDPGEEATPSVVRTIASLLMASYRYAKAYSEESLTENDYSARLEKRALALLDGVANGTIVLWDKDYPVTDASTFNSADFWPNDSYTPEYVEFQKELEPELQPKRAFSMDREF